MQYKDDVFMTQFVIVKRFVYHLIYYRVLTKAYQEHNLQSEFWTHTIDAHLLQAANHWCMVFGSHGCNPTHWKNLSKSNLDELERSFRKDIQDETGLSLSDWEEYWTKMTEFRNKYVAHREIIFTESIPDFDIALKISYCYDNWIRKVIYPDTFEEPSLQQSASKIQKKMAPRVDYLLQTYKTKLKKRGG